MCPQRSFHQFPSDMWMRSPRPGASWKPNTAKKFVVIATCLLITISSIIVGVTIGWKLRVRGFQDVEQSTSFDGRTIAMGIYLVSVDVIQGGTTFGWFINGDNGCEIMAPDPSSLNCSSVNIFFDENALLRTLDDSIVTSDNARPMTPIFTWNPLSLPDERGKNAEFRTPLQIYPSSYGFQNYPFDIYAARFRLYAQDAITNETVGVDILESDGIAVGFTVHALSDLIDDFPVPPGVIVQFYLISRGSLVKAYCIIIVMAVWVITLIFVSITARTVIFGYGHRADLLIIPVGTLFAVTQLRQTMPQAPVGYGAIIDYVGLLPCLALMAACAAIDIGALAFLNPTEARETIVDRLLRKKLGYHNDLEGGGKSKCTLGGSSLTERDEDFLLRGASATERDEHDRNEAKF